MSKQVKENGGESVEAIISDKATGNVGNTKQQEKESKYVKQTIVYAGPTIIGVVSCNTIFNNGITGTLSEVAEKVPAIRNLIIPIGNLAQTRAEINKKNSAANICYERVLDFIKKGE